MFWSNSIPLHLVTPITYIHAAVTIVRQKHGRRTTDMLLRIVASRRPVKRLRRQVRVQDTTLVLQEKPSLGRVFREFSARSRVAGILRCVHRVKDRWDRVNICVSIIYGAKWVSGTLRRKRSLIRACKDGPIAWRDVRELPAHGLGVRFHYRNSISVCTPEDAIGTVVGKAIGIIWLSMIGQTLSTNIAPVGFGLRWSWWLWSTKTCRFRHLLLGRSPRECSLRSRARPKQKNITNKTRPFEWVIKAIRAITAFLVKN